MAITFEHAPLRWENAGSEPDESLKKSGYTAGMKPAASTFNYQINNASACLTELQTEVSELDTTLNMLSETVCSKVYEEKTLYSSNGTSGTITLSDNVSNYDYLEIYWKENTTTSFFCSKVTPTFKPKWSLCEQHYSSTDGYYVFNSKFLTITGTTIKQENVGYANVKTNIYPNVRSENNIYILKVKGYKKLI